METIYIHIIITQNNVDDYIHIYNKHVLNGLDEIVNIAFDLSFNMNETIYIHIDKPVSSKTIFSYLDLFCSKLISLCLVSSAKYSYSQLPCSNKDNLYFPIFDTNGNIIQNTYLLTIIK